MMPFQNYYRHGNWSSVCFCSGVVAGLITITPGSGYVCSRELVSTHNFDAFSKLLEAALFFGIFGSAICYFAPELKRYGGYDDALDVGVTILKESLHKLLSSLVDFCIPWTWRFFREHLHWHICTIQGICFIWPW